MAMMALLYKNTVVLFLSHSRIQYSVDLSWRTDLAYYFKRFELYFYQSTRKGKRGVGYGPFYF